MHPFIGRLALHAAALLAVSPALAASLPFYTDRAEFDAATAARPFQTETFAGGGDGEVVGPTTTFETGLRLEFDRTAPDNFFDAGALHLSIENPFGRSGFEHTQRATFTLPNPASFLGIDFGRIADGGRGIGNDSGTVLELLNGDTIIASLDFGDLAAERPNGQYVGFLGYYDEVSWFDAIRFTSAGRGTKNDDDFLIDDLVFESRVAAVPLPASAPMLVAAIVFAGMISVRRTARPD